MSAHFRIKALNELCTSQRNCIKKCSANGNRHKSSSSMASMMYMLMIRERTQQRLKERNLRLLFGGTIESHKKITIKSGSSKGEKTKKYGRGSV